MKDYGIIFITSNVKRYLVVQVSVMNACIQLYRV